MESILTISEPMLVIESEGIITIALSLSDTSSISPPGPVLTIPCDGVTKAGFRSAAWSCGIDIVKFRFMLPLLSGAPSSEKDV